MYYFLPTQESVGKKIVTFHISFFIEYKVIFPRQVIMSIIYCFYGIFFLFPSSCGTEAGWIFKFLF